MEYEHETPRALVERSAEPFFGRVASALGTVAERYDVMVLDCPPQLGFLTLGALCASTGLLITVHPQMLDVMSMCQFLLMASDVLRVVQSPARILITILSGMWLRGMNRRTLLKPKWWRLCVHYSASASLRILC